MSGPVEKCERGLVLIERADGTQQMVCVREYRAICPKCGRPSGETTVSKVCLNWHGLFERANLPIPAFFQKHPRHRHQGTKRYVKLSGVCQDCRVKKAA